MSLLRALELAARGYGEVDPNPLVGAVLVRDGEVVGEGYHERIGGPHAEVHALREAGEKARGATLYVTLEPCCHHGRTPPCAPQVIEAGVRRVVVALADPDPRVSGQGLQALRQAGLEVELAEGELARQARELNRFFLTSVTSGRPFVTLKYAMTLDGKIATHTGDSRWITGPAARQRVHHERWGHQAILVGVSTVLADDCELSARLEREVRQPLRIVLDSQARMGPNARVLNGPALVVVSPEADPGRVARLESAGAEVWTLPRHDLPALLKELHRRQIRSLFVEGGGSVHASFLEQGLAHRVLAFLAPKLVGGARSPSPVQGEGVATMADAWQLHDVRWEQLDQDLVLDGRTAAK